ncbi:MULTISPECIES: EhaE family protein [unclassified Methanopyrus]|uniref:EhaE family protein n=1 Tax=Methanopyrus sp. SNP6 TaxID=1937005 RepID=UPI0011E5E293|nr:EhaE family protein [Methanopyrus sp. SNP6]
MHECEVILYTGAFMIVVGTLGAAIGPARSDPVVKSLNLELATVGVCLVFLAFNHLLALITFIAVGAFATPILMRAILRVEASERDREALEGSERD